MFISVIYYFTNNWPCYPDAVFSWLYLVRPRLCYRLASVVVCTECIVAKRCVLEQKLLFTAYAKSYMSNRLVPERMTLTFV